MFDAALSIANKGAVLLPAARLMRVPVGTRQRTGAGLPARAIFYCIRLATPPCQAVCGGREFLLPRAAAASPKTRSDIVTLGIVAHRKTRLICQIVGAGVRVGSRSGYSAVRRRERGQSPRRNYSKAGMQ